MARCDIPAIALIALILTALALPSIKASLGIIPPLKLSDIEYYIMLSSSAQLILPNVAGKPIGTIPVGNALAADWSAAGYFGGLAERVKTVYDTDATYVNPSSGRPTAAADFGLMHFGGPFVNIPVWYYEKGGGNSPIYFDSDSNDYWFVRRGVGEVAGSRLSWSTIKSGARGMILFEFFKDDLGRYVFIAYGFTWWDTFGAALFFHGEIWPNLKYYTKSWYIVERVDNGNGNVEDPGVDTYNVIASGS